MVAEAKKQSSVGINNLIEKTEGLVEDAKHSLSSVLSKELRHLPVWRSGFGAQVNNLFAASKEGGVEGTGQDRKTIDELNARADQTQILIDLARNLLDRAQESQDIDRANAWRLFVKHYAVVTGMATVDKDVEKALAPVVDFMATGPRKKDPAKNEDKEPTPVKPTEDDNG